MTTIGYATLQIVPSLRGVSDAIDKQLAPIPGMGRDAGKRLGDGIAEGVGAPGKKIGKELQDGVGRGAQGAAGEVSSRLSERLGAQVGSVVGKGIGAGIKLGIAGAAGAAAVAVGGIGIALSKGFDRLKLIDQAKFKLGALGHDAASTATIMDNAMSAVKGTAFGMGDAANIAASAVAAGVKPGKDLAKYLSDVADAAAVSGTDLASMGDVMNNVSTLNAAYNDSLQVLAQRGLPIYEWLSKATGKTTAEVKELASEGKISAQTFREAIEANIGGAAQKMGQSFDGAVDNMEASVARLGANFITAILGGDSSDPLAGPTEAIGKLTEKFDLIGKYVQEHGPEIRQYFVNIVNDVKPVVTTLGQVATFLGDHPRLIEAAVGAFALFKTVSGVSALASSLGSIASGLDGLPGKAKFSAGGISSALAAIAIPAALYEILNGAAQDKIKQWDDAYWKRHDEDNRRQDLGLKPQQPGVGDFGGAPAVGQGNAPSAPKKALPNDELRAKVAAGQVQGFSIAPNGQIIGPDGKPVPGFGFGGYSGNLPTNQVAGVVHGAEFVVNAAATRKNLSLLEVINSGKLPGYSGGGLVDSYGVNSGSNSGGYGGGGTQFPDWVYQVGQAFGVKPSTYPGHQESDRNEAGYAPNPGHANRGIDWTGSVANMQKFAEYLRSTGQLEQVIWKNPKTGQEIGVAGGRDVSGSYYGEATYNEHSNHVHTRQSSPIPLPGGSTSAPSDNSAAPSSAAPAGDQAANTVSSTASAGGGAGPLPSSFSGLSSFGLNSLGAGVGTTQSGSDLSKFGSAAGSAVSGQVSSALGVFGVGDSPPILQAATKLLGGLKVGGHDPSGASDGSLFNGANPLGSFGSAAPISASPAGSGTPPPDGAAHGANAGQNPGPQTVYNIRTATVEDAFLAAQRKQDVAARTKLSRF